jgi:hypothetical protein
MIFFLERRKDESATRRNIRSSKQAAEFFN